MPHTGLETLITAAFEDRANINAETQGDIRRAVDSALRLLDAGKLRVAEKVDGKEGPDGWKVNQWLKKAVLLSFRGDVVPNGGWLFVAHGLLLGLVLLAPRAREAGPLGRFLGDWYPMLLLAGLWLVGHGIVVQLAK